MPIIFVNSTPVLVHAADSINSSSLTTYTPTVETLLLESRADLQALCTRAGIATSHASKDEVAAKVLANWGAIVEKKKEKTKKKVPTISGYEASVYHI